MIVKVLKKEFPDYGILAEEGNRHNLKSENLWIIDPLDGTHNYMRGMNIYGVSIGLWQKDDFTKGVIYMPEDGDVFWAEKGKGAFKNGERISVSGVKDFKDCCLSYDSSIRYAPDIMLGVLHELCSKVFNIRMFGSSVRVLTYLAEGKVDFSIEFHDQPWDFAGGVCLVREAGGIVSPLKKGVLTPMTVGYIAGNSNLYAIVDEIIRRHLKNRG
jgi:myo-inositol-1(or 4)-monophosphatase